MPDVLPTIGFWSYGRQDDLNTRGRMSELRQAVVAELQLHHAGRPEEVIVHQDTGLIATGDNWAQRIRDAIDGSFFLIPILTPGFFHSEWCCREVRMFIEREKNLNRGDLIFPVKWIALDPIEAARPLDIVVWDRLVNTTQNKDFTQLRRFSVDREDVQAWVEQLTLAIKAALRRPETRPSPQPPKPPPRVASPVPPPPPETPAKPAWASNAGTDKFGEWAEFAVPVPGAQPVVQRMRLIPAGRFQMGSPDDEEGRWPNEGPVHDVNIRQPFWLFDTPCPKDLWHAVMGDNPSRVASPRRPVENVSFNDVGPFLEILNRRIAGLNLALPTEAQWEYACRARTGGPRYGALDDIAWHAGNSGGQAHDVAGKTPNAFGLYDMLGNVWEWCEDGWSNTYDGAPVDGTARPAADGSASRVLRGGSWFNDARDVRSAVRHVYVPSNRGLNVGFRCARVRNSD